MKILSNIKNFFQHLMRSIQHGVLMLFTVIRSDLQSLFGGVFNGGKALKDSQAFNRRKTLNHLKRALHKAYPSRFPPLLSSWRALISTEWSQFRAEIEILRSRIHQIRNQTDVQKLVGLLSPFDSEKKTILAASIVINLLALAFPLLMLQLYDRILPHQSMDTLGLFSITVGIAVALESVTRIARSYTTAWISARFEHKAMMEVAERALVEPLHEFERLGTGAVMESFKSISSLKYHYSGQTYQQLMDLPFTIFYLLIIFILNVWIGLLVTFVYVVFVYITWKMGRNDPELIRQQKMAD